MSAASTIASASANNTPTSTTQTTLSNNAVPRPSMRSNSQVKNIDGPRRQSPIDAAARRPPLQKAWATGLSPLNHRAPSVPHSNGVTNLSKTAKMNVLRDSGLSDKHAHDRSIAAFGAAMGSCITLSTKNGEKYEGALAGMAFTAGNTKISTKMTKKVQHLESSLVNGAVSREAALVGTSPEYAMTFDMRDVIDVILSDLSLAETAKMANGTSSQFRTDADISGNLVRGPRTLQKWVPDSPDNTDYSLEGGPAAEWDQFATAKQMTGMESTYHENDYTTALDRSSLNYKMREAAAAQKEREILSTVSANRHIAEERGHVTENEPDDEEAKYSGVRRDDTAFPPLGTGGPNKYTPPAKRAPTAQPTVPGAPVDPAIISTSKPIIAPNESDKENIAGSAKPVKANTTDKGAQENSAPRADLARPPNASVSPHRVPPGGQTEGVEGRLLQQFREFKDTEKQKLIERKKAQASQDRNAKLSELLRFSKTFKLKTPIPGDLVGILAKDPHKQEAIIEKAKREHEESTSAAASPAAPAVADVANRKLDLQQTPPIPDRQTFNKGRGGFPSTGARGTAQQALLPGRGAAIFQRSAAGRDSKPMQPHPIPTAIPIPDRRVPPTGPMADQRPITSPQRSTLQTPTSATSSKFNLSVKAAEFRPNAAAPSFNPGASSNAPSSPSSVQRTTSVSRAASPSTFFGARRPKPLSERYSVSDSFNPLKRMKEEVASRAASEKNARSEAGKSQPRDFASNGGIPNAYQTGPRWIVRAENEEKTYLAAFERPAIPAVPLPGRTGSTHHTPYQNQVPHMPTGPGSIPQISTPHHMHNGVPHHFQHQYDDGQARNPMMPMGQVYSSPSLASRQPPSAYASPMGHNAQLAYGQQPYFGAGNALMAMPMRYPGTPGTHQGAPMMVSQQSNGPYMAMPQQYNGQMPMYSPNPAHAYPQSNGYGSPSRAPMMVQQGSQHGPHAGQPMMYTMSQGGPMGYPQQGGIAPTRYGGPQYGSSPQQPYGMQQRTMSSGYGQKMMSQHLQPGQGPPMNAPQQPAAYTQMEMGQDDGK